MLKWLLCLCFAVDEGRSAIADALFCGCCVDTLLFAAARVTGFVTVGGVLVPFLEGVRTTVGMYCAYLVRPVKGWGWGGATVSSISGCMLVCECIFPNQSWKWYGSRGERDGLLCEAACGHLYHSRRGILAQQETLRRGLQCRQCPAPSRMIAPHSAAPSRHCKRWEVNG